MKKLLVSITLLVMLPAFGFAKKHPKQWQSGILVAEYTHTGQRSPLGRYSFFEDYVIRGNDGINYKASQFLAFKWSRPANLVINDPVKFRVDGRRLFIEDDRGKSYKFDLIERVRQASDQTQSAN